MLQIRPMQMTVFEDSAYDAWVDEVLEDVLACWPRLEASPELRMRLRDAAKEAAELGLQTKGEWLRYANCAIALGDELSHAAAQDLLRGSAPQVRLERLAAWTMATLRAR